MAPIWPRLAPPPPHLSKAFLTSFLFPQQQPLRPEPDGRRAVHAATAAAAAATSGRLVVPDADAPARDGRGLGRAPATPPATAAAAARTPGGHRGADSAAGQTVFFF